MANQYTGNFESIIQKTFNCSAKEMLQECVSDGLSYTGAADKLGFRHGTVRKWARRFGLKLKPAEPPRLEKEEFIKLFNEDRMNQYNMLSRNWLQAGGLPFH